MYLDKDLPLWTGSCWVLESSYDLHYITLTQEKEQRIKKNLNKQLIHSKGSGRSVHKNIYYNRQKYKTLLQIGLQRVEGWPILTFLSKRVMLKATEHQKKNQKRN